MKKQNIYLLLGLSAVLNGVWGNILGSACALLFPTAGLGIGDLFSGLGIPLLLLSWYFYRKNKYQGDLIEPNKSKYMFWGAVSIMVLFVMSTFLLLAWQSLQVKSNSNESNLTSSTTLQDIVGQEHANEYWDKYWQEQGPKIRRRVMMSNIVLVTCSQGSDSYVGTGVVRATSSKTSDWRVFTNAHIVGDLPVVGSESCLISLTGLDDSSVITEEFPATVELVSKNYPFVDFAVLKPSTDFTFGDFTISECSIQQNEKGDNVEVIGYPDTGDGMRIATEGVISDIFDSEGGTVVETTAAVQPGNSGGIALNLDKDCSIGIVTWKDSERPVGYIQTWEMLGIQ